MRYALLPLLIISLVSSVGAEDSRPLFDGTTLDGWVQRGGEATYEIDADAEGGAQIIGTSVADTPNSFLCTEQHYGDFVLEFDVKIDSGINSGVQFRSHCYESPTMVNVTNSRGETHEKTVSAGRVHGYQAEIDPSPRAWSGGVYDEGRRGWIFNLEGDDHADAREAFDPDGWNRYRIEAVGDRIRTWINDVPVADFEDPMTASGFIALQVHSVGSDEQVGRQVRWRNLQISER